MNTQNDQISFHDNKSILNDLKSIHTLFPLCGEPRNAILDLPDNLLLYTVSLFKNQPPQLPDISITKWYDFLSNLTPHWVLPLMYWHIMQIPRDVRPPKEIIDILQKNFFNSRIRSLIVEKQIHDIVDQCEKENLQIIVLKGSALARTVYPDSALRSSSDIDLLVLPEDFIKCRLIMEKLGYKCIKKGFNISKSWYCEEEFYCDDPKKNYLPVEIHWSLIEPSILRCTNDRLVFDRAITVKTPTVSFKALDPVDNIIHISMHWGFKHNTELRLSWIYDIYLLCKNLTNDEWITLQKRSVEYGARVPIEKLLVIVQYWTDLRIPSEFADFSKWPKPMKYEVRAASCMKDFGTNPLSAFTLHWPRSAPLSEKIKTASFILFPPLADMRDLYTFKSDWMVTVYYFIRWYDVIKKILKRFIFPDAG